MANLEVEVKVVGADQASNDLKDFGNSAKDAGDNIKTAGSNVQTTASKLSDFKTNLVGVAGSLTSVSTGIIGVVSSFTRLEQAQIRVDSANRKVETSAIAVTKAQEKYNDAVKKYGENSSQAQKAAESLKTAQEGHSIAIDRAELAQSRLNETMASFGSEIANNVIGVFGSIVSAITTFATKGESGVSLAGKLKQSFLDLVSGGSNVKSTLDTAGGAMGGLGTNAEAAGKSAGTLRSEVAQLGGGIAQAIPNIGQFSGGITNTAAAAERTAGPLGNIERSVASTAAEVGGAVAPLGAFAGGMGATGTAAEGAVGGLEAAAASTGALEAGSVSAAAESAGLATAIGTVSVGLAAETAGISLAVAALAIYVFNIGGAKDKTDAAVTSAKNFLAVGWDSFAQKFKPVNDVLDKTIGQWITLLDKQKQFSEQPPPGQALAPGGTQGTLDEVAAREQVSKARQGVNNLQDILLFGGGDVLSQSIQQVNDYRAALQGLTVATEPLKTGIRGDTSAVSQLTIDLKAGSAATEAATAAHQKLVQPVQLVGRASTLQAQAINQAKDAMNETINITQKAAQNANQYGQAIRELESGITQTDATLKGHVSTLQQVDTALGTAQGTIQANNKILNSSVEVQKLWTTGWDQMTVKLQQAQKDLVTSEGALAKLDQALSTGQPQLTAYNQGWVDFNMKMDEAIVSANKAQGEFDSFVTTLGSGKEQLANFDTGFTNGEAAVQKWATQLRQGNAEIEGTRAALEKVIPKLGVNLPDSLNLSNKAMMDFTESITSGSDALTKNLEAADKEWKGILDDFNKAAMQAPEDQRKAWGDFQKTTHDAFDELQKALQGHTQNQQQAWADYYKKIGEAQGKFTKDSNDAWNTYFQALQDTLARPLTAGEAQITQAMAGMSESLKRGIGQLNFDLSNLKLGLPNSAFTMQKDFNDLIASLEQQLQTLPPQARTSYQALIDQVARLPANTQDDWNKKISGLTAIYRDINSPASTFADTSQNVSSALQGIQNTNPQQPVNQFGNAAQTQIDFIQALRSISSDLANTLSVISKGTYTINIDTSKALKDLGGLQNVLDTVTNKTTYKISLSLDTSAITSSLQTLQTWINDLTATIAPAFNTAFATGANDAVGSINQLMANASTQLGLLQPMILGIVNSLSGIWVGMANAASAQFNAIVASASTQLGVLPEMVAGIVIAINGTWLGMSGAAAAQFNAIAASAATQLGLLPTMVAGIVIAINGTWQGMAGAAAAQFNAIMASAATQLGLLPTMVAQIVIAINGTWQGMAGAAAAVFNKIMADAGTQLGLLPTMIAQIVIAVNGTMQGMAGAAAAVFNSIAASASTQLGTLVPMFQGILSQMIQYAQTHAIVVRVDTSAAQMAINQLKMQLLQLQSAGQPGVPLQSRFGAEKGGTFALGPTGFVPVKEQHAARGGSFVVTKQMRLGNLTVGEGNKPELLSYIPTRAGGKHVGMLTVIPLPTLKAAAGGVFGATPNLSSPPTMSFMPQTGQPISYGAGLPAPGASTVGAGTRLGYVEAGPGVVQQGPPSSDPNLQAKPGPVTSPGNFFSVGPGTLPAGLSGGQQGQVSTSIVGGINDASPYDQAQLTGESVAAEIKPQQQEMQSQLTDLLTMIKQMIRKMGTRDINANLMIDGQKMASTVQKYMGNDAYGGR